MSAYIPENNKKVTALRLREMKRAGEKIAMLTALKRDVGTPDHSAHYA